MRACGNCDRFTPNQPWNIATDCRLCWLNHHEPKYRKHFAKPVTKQATKPAPGPGTELKRLLRKLGINGVADCGCDERAARMNRWGITGCQENFDTIRGWLVEAESKASWFDKVRAGVNAARIGLPIDFGDIPGSLVRLAIERAENSTDGRVADSPDAR